VAGREDGAFRRFQLLNQRFGITFLSARGLSVSLLGENDLDKQTFAKTVRVGMA